MNIFKKHTFTVCQVGALKLSAAAFGIAIGAYWHDFFSFYISSLILLGLLCAVYVLSVYMKQK